ncbi:hypothetical protein [Candidatus Enterococcus murrayae]|uniref:WxL domain-containing protein n=1 Tax=Candidatus Enterococcus murrayae TaxID=2815321 RepID=A0ABS3HHP2_9ENTE|nr:hypothetical protein [Enterococcus sp. MJM16]MBO0452977.1 hypothetical protein [Enterococcus sp. MJM16]
MKKHVRLATSIIALTALLATGASASAATQTIDGREGEDSAVVPVNGIIGEFDNTTPGPDPVDTNKWINVTLPTTALFYSEAGNVSNLVAPNYTITNNSARKVDVIVEDVENLQATSVIDSLSINTIELIDSGVKSTSLTGTDSLFELDDNSNAAAASNSFTFTGSASGALTLSDEVNPSFDLILKFIPIIS